MSANADETQSIPSEGPNREEILISDLREILQRFSDSQYEILRLVNYIEKFKPEIDDEGERIRERVKGRVHEDLDEASLDQLIQLVIPSPEAQIDKDTAAQILDDVLEKIPPAHIASYVDGITKAFRPAPTGEFLYPSLLVTLVGELEVSINHLVRACYNFEPRLLRAGEQTVRWDEISGLSSIQDVMNLLVDRKVDTLLRASLGEWLKFFEKDIKTGPLSVNERNLALECVQRRHCVVHNGGHASSLYIQNTRNLISDVEEGDYLAVDATYLEEAADELFLVLLSLAWSIGNKFCKNSEHTDALTNILLNATFFLLQEKRYGLLKLIHKENPIKDLSDQDQLILNTNSWLAYKFSNEFELVRNEVENLETIGKSRKFNLAKYCLLDRNEEAIKVALSMLRDDELKRTQLATWPLLRDISRDIQVQWNEHQFSNSIENRKSLT